MPKRSNPSSNKRQAAAAKRVSKNLITLDSYEPDVSDNVQNENIWNEMNPNERENLVHRQRREERDSVSNQDKSGSDSEDASGSSDAESMADSTSASVTSAASTPSSSTSAAQKRARSDSVESESRNKEENTETNSSLSKEEEEFQKAEAERDAALPEEYRRFRPRGFNFRIPPKDRPVRIYADGVFDSFHLGHMKQLEQAKKSSPNVTMVVGVPNDELVHKYKGSTVSSEDQRYESSRHCRWVDEVIPNAPWEVNAEFLDKHQIDYVAHDNLPYAGPDGQDDVYKFVKERGQFMTTQRTDGISTSDIITRIVKDYDSYLMRNFKRGVSRKESNVSWIKKNELDIKRHVNAFRESWRHNVETATRDMYADLLAYALNAPRNSVVGRARDWVSRRMESHAGSPQISDTDSPESPDSPNSHSFSPEISNEPREIEHNNDSNAAAISESQREGIERNPKRRRVSTA